MKKVNSIFWASLLVMSAAMAQSPFQGTIQYKMDFIGEGMESMQAMFPTGMVIAVLKTDVMVELQGGMAAMMMGRTIMKTKKGISYMVKDSEEKIYVMDPEKMKGDEDPTEANVKPQVTKEDEVITIAGYECQKYKVVTHTPQGESTAFVWTTDQFAIPKSSRGAGSSISGMMDMEGVSGTPLKIMTEQGPVTVTFTADEVITRLPDKKLFKLPKGYTIEDFDASSMMGGM
ncbi:MAG: hypothetical protein RLZZ165_384 [Bacteroidota bacterium]|jgi:hypothetical protein